MDAPLTAHTLDIAEKTISSNTFFYIVMHHLLNHTSLSVVRMGDGERILLDAATDEDLLDGAIVHRNAYDIKVKRFDDQWLTRMGLLNITYGELLQRLQVSVYNADYFAPSVTGLVNKGYALHSYFHLLNHPHKLLKLVDNFFVNEWHIAKKQELLQKADGVLLIHSNAVIADAMQRKYSRFKISYLKLSSWEQTEQVIADASNNLAQLVLYSGGCAGKYIGPAIAQQGKVVIDVGNSMDSWVV